MNKGERLVLRVERRGCEGLEGVEGSRLTPLRVSGAAEFHRTSDDASCD